MFNMLLVKSNDKKADVHEFKRTHQFVRNEKHIIVPRLNAKVGGFCVC